MIINGSLGVETKVKSNQYENNLNIRIHIDHCMSI